ncbi:MAG TPA: fibronectin type III-like domain-contianing protein, partial [Puia sp.]|nr:fibronectin type III-like domain-contianing protein [Puia sp.]
IPSPFYALKSFKRISLAPGESANIPFAITNDMLQLINEQGQSVWQPGKYKISIGGSLPGKRSEELGAARGVEGEITLK